MRRKLRAVRRQVIGLDEQELRRLYADEGFTAAAVAARLECSATTVRRRLRTHGVSVRRRGPCPRRSPDQVSWSSELAYAVGLIATDGNLSRDRRHLAMSSKDGDLLETLRKCLDLRASVTPYRSGTGRWHLHIQWSDRPFHEWLMSIGLTPAKSLSLGPLAVPDTHFADFMRGCIDGDGSIIVYVDRNHSNKNGRYVYERLYVTLTSASRPFLDWAQATTRRLGGIAGTLTERTSPEKRPVWVLRYAKRESVRLLRWIYYSQDLPCLARKRARAERFLRRSS